MNNGQPSRHRLFSFFALSLLALSGTLLAVTGVPPSQAQGIEPPVTPEPITGDYQGRVVGAASLNLRNGPHFTYTAVAYLLEGEQVRLVGRNRAATWYQIELYNGYRGWVNARYIQPSMPILALPVADVPLLGLTAFVANDPIMVYAGPGRLHVPVAIARPGTVLILNARNDTATWVFAFLPDGRAGWVPADSPFLPAAPLNNLPIITPFSDTTPYPAAPYLVYAGPGYLFEPFYRVAAGQSLTIRGRTGDARWVLVQLPDGREGWLTADIVQPATPLDQIPIIPGIAPPQAVSWTTADGTSQGSAGKGIPQATSALTPTPTALTTALAPATGTPTATVSPAPTATATSAPATEEPTATTTTAVPPATPTAGASVPVYRAPDDTEAPLLRVTPGQSVVILGRTADAQWIKIMLPVDIEGWVRARDVQLNLELDLLPIITP